MFKIVTKTKSLNFIISFLIWKVLESLSTKHKPSVDSIQCFLFLNISSYCNCSLNVATAEVNIHKV